MTLGFPSDPAGAALESDVEARGMVPWGRTPSLLSDPAEVAPENAVDGRRMAPETNASASIARGSLQWVFMAAPLLRGSECGDGVDLAACRQQDARCRPSEFERPRA